MKIKIIKKKKRKIGDQNVVYAGSKNIYLRNQYKTFKQYGQKKYAFNSTKFSKAVNKFVEQQNSEEDIVYLLSDKNGNRITNDSIGNYIKRFTLNKLTESDYNKIAVSQVKDMSDYPLLKSISEKRGTSVPTLVSEYNLNIKLTE
jgi:CRISPR/Cas system CMR subunit Cmr4 (Cas7 group RAMP superfamily)